MASPIILFGDDGLIVQVSTLAELAAALPDWVPALPAARQPVAVFEEEYA